MYKEEEFLAQATTIGTTAGSLFSPEAGEQIYLTRIWIGNTDTAARQYSLYLDDDGVVYTNATAIAPLVTLAAGKGEYVDLNIPMRNSAGNFAVKTSTAGSFTFTLFGIRL